MFKFQSYNPTEAGQVAANRGGAITAEQKAALKWHADVRWFSLFTPVVILSIAFVVVMFVVWYTVGTGLPIWGYAIIVAFFGFGFLAAIVPQVWRLVGALRTRNDLANGQIESLEGQVAWRWNNYTAEAPGRRLRLPLGMAGLRPGSYRFYFLPNTGWLLSAERLTPPGGEDLNAELLAVLTRVQGISVQTIEANRRGRLAVEQLLKLFLSIAGSFILFSLIVAVTGAVGWYVWPVIEDTDAQWIALLVGGLVVLIVLVVFLVNAARLGIDILRGQAASAQGIVNRTVTVTTGGEGSSVTYYCQIERLKFRVPKAAYNALVDGIPYRVYYAPLSKRLMAIEPV